MAKISFTSRTSQCMRYLTHRYRFHMFLCGRYRRFSIHFPTLLISSIIIIFIYILFLRRLLFVDDSEFTTGGLVRSGHAVSLGGSGQACVHPNLQVDRDTLAKLRADEEVETLNCADRQDEWIYVSDDGRLFYNSTLLRLRGVSSEDVDCTYIDLIREDDFKNLDSQEQTISPIDGAKPSSDFVRVTCKQSKGIWPLHKTTYSLLSHVRRREEVARRAADTRHNLPPHVAAPNIYFLSFDSVSRILWLELLAKSTDYFVKKLGGVVLEGYNIVGDGTPACFTPILTGHIEEELPHVDKSMSDWQYVDVYPMLWKRLHQLGYVSLFSEDMPEIGTYLYRMAGFREQPTDHYGIPLHVEGHVKGIRKDLCMGGQSSHNLTFTYLLQFADAYPDCLKMWMHHHAELSHEADRMTGLRVADEDLLHLLKSMDESGHLDNALFFLFSDHGHRFSKVRASAQGRLEERLPFFAVYMSPNLRKIYPLAYTNLVGNARRLVTPFDIHATLLEAITGGEVGVGRAISLFQPIPSSRTCYDAGIEEHWCACLDWEQTDIRSGQVVAAAKSLLTHINQYLTKISDEDCVPLTLTNITRAQSLIPNRNLMQPQYWFGLRFLPRRPLISTITYQLGIEAAPSGAQFEGLITYDQHKDVYAVNLDLVDRINRYGRQGHCVPTHVENPRKIRKFCYCKHQLPEEEVN